MDTRESLMKMLARLLEDMSVMQQHGTGYYSVAALANRYNKLLAEARSIVGLSNGLMKTFENLPEIDPKDPGEKTKVVISIRIEIGQLLALLESQKG
jgi:hypothetical protein